jgi:hypothetical protein
MRLVFKTGQRRSQALCISRKPGKCLSVFTRHKRCWVIGIMHNAKDERDIYTCIVVMKDTAIADYFGA